MTGAGDPSHQSRVQYPEECPTMTHRPILASTMGDPAGIGPEICVRALLSPEVRDASRSFVIGDARVLQKALAVCGLTGILHRISGPEDIADQDGVIDVLHQADSADPAVLPENGRSPALCRRPRGVRGHQDLDRSRDGATGSRRVVTRAPINKESLQAAKIPLHRPYRDVRRVYRQPPRRNDDVHHLWPENLLPDPAHVGMAKACAAITVDRVGKGIDHVRQSPGPTGPRDAATSPSPP